MISKFELVLGMQPAIHLGYVEWSSERKLRSSRENAMKQDVVCSESYFFRQKIVFFLDAYYS